MEIKRSYVGRNPSACENKHHYGTFAGATHAAEKMNANRSTISHAFYCAACGSFHVGTRIEGEADMFDRSSRFDPEPDVLNDLDEADERYGRFRVSW
jgi:hypothetical protein